MFEANEPYFIKQKKLVFGAKVCAFGSIHSADESEFPLLGTSDDLFRERYLIYSISDDNSELDNKQLNRSRED